MESNQNDIAGAILHLCSCSGSLLSSMNVAEIDAPSADQDLVILTLALPSLFPVFSFFWSRFEWIRPHGFCVGIDMPYLTASKKSPPWCGSRIILMLGLGYFPGLLRSCRAGHAVE